MAESQIDVAAKEFRKSESSEENQEGDNRFYESGRDVLPGEEKLYRPIPKCRRRMMQKERNDPRRSEEREREGKPLEVELDLSGGIPQGKYVEAESRKLKGCAFSEIWQF